MAVPVRVLIAEKNGVELDMQEEYNLTAFDSSYDNTSSGLTATDTQAAIDEIVSTTGVSASPGFTWGRSGNVPTSTWLNNESVPSNKAGRYVAINNAKIKQIFIGNQDISTYDISVYEHEGDEVNLTLLTTVSVVAARGGAFDVDVAVTTGRQLALRVTSGSANNLTAGVQLKGEL